MAMGKTDACKSFCGILYEMKSIKGEVSLCSDDKYTQVMTDEGCFLQRKTLTYWENILPRTNFSRVNRSCLINLRYYKKEGSYVVLGEKKRVKIGRIYKNQLEKNYREYLWTLARMM